MICLGFIAYFISQIDDDPGTEVGLAVEAQGRTLATDYLCATSCPPSYHQQASTSAFVAALNSGTETFAGIDYTAIYTLTDTMRGAADSQSNSRSPSSARQPRGCSGPAAPPSVSCSSRVTVKTAARGL